MLKEIEIGDLVRMAPNSPSYGKRSEHVGLVIDFVKTTSALWDTPGVCARVEWANGVKTLTGLLVLELV